MSQPAGGAQVVFELSDLSRQGDAALLRVYIEEPLSITYREDLSDARAASLAGGIKAFLDALEGATLVDLARQEREMLAALPAETRPLLLPATYPIPPPLNLETVSKRTRS